MNSISRYGWRKLLLETLLIVLALLMLYPFYLAIINSFKSYQEVSASLLAFPSKPTLVNFSHVWNEMDYPRAFLNSVVITVCSVAGVIAFSAAAAYRLVRRPGRTSSFIFFMVISSLVIPFQIVMVPALMVARTLHLVNTIQGVILMYWGFLVPTALFFFHGFVKTIPYELEESARMDGCGPFRIFFRIVLPLLLPIATIITIIDVLAVYNDFMLPLVMISSNTLRTLPLAVSVFFTAYSFQWNSIMTALTMSLLPIVVFFLFMQRYIVRGLVAGAVKG